MKESDVVVRGEFVSTYIRGHCDLEDQGPSRQDLAPGEGSSCNADLSRALTRRDLSYFDVNDFELLT